MSDDKPTLAEQFAADAAAVEAEYQNHLNTMKTRYPGMWEAMMNAVDEPSKKTCD
jgi:hypothetical protein